MADGWLVSVILMVVIAAVLLAGGYHIRAHRDLSLLAGYNLRRQIRNRDGLARWFGGGLLGLGAATLGVAVPMLVRPSTGPWIGRPYGALVIVTVVGLTVGGRRYAR
jgi:hypothetical protein